MIMIALGIGWYRPHSNFVHDLMQFPFRHAFSYYSIFLQNSYRHVCFAYLFWNEVQLPTCHWLLIEITLRHIRSSCLGFFFSTTFYNFKSNPWGIDPFNELWLSPLQHTIYPRKFVVNLESDSQVVLIKHNYFTGFRGCYKSVLVYFRSSIWD